MIRAIRPWWVVLTLIARAVPAAAQTPPAAPFVDHRIGTVSVTVEGRPSSDASILSAIVTRTGQPLKMEDVRESLAHLYNLRRFEDVEVLAQPGPDGSVGLVYDVRPVHTVTRVEFRGTLGLPESALRARMTERFTATPPVGRAEDVAVVLTQLYHDSGYLSGTVKAAPPLIYHQPESATLVFDVDAGPRAVIANATIGGHPQDPVDRVIDRLNIRPKTPYDPDDLHRRMNEYAASYRHRGYYEAALRDHETVRDGGQVDVGVDVEPGPLVAVRFTGDPLPKDKIAELVPIEAEGSVDQDLLEDSARRIADYLHQQGYWRAAVNPPDRQEADGRLSIVFTVQRGELYRVAQSGADITGNRGVTIDDLRPLLHMAPGDPFVASKMEASAAAIKQLYRTRGYASVEVDAAANEAAPGLVTPSIVIKEGPRIVIGTISFTGTKAKSPADLLKVVTLKTGDVYYGPTIAQARDSIQLDYLNAGYAAATVNVAPVTPVVSGNTARADIVFQVNEGAQTIVDHIFIQGNLKTDESIIKRELRLKEGQPLGLADLTESRRRLATLGLFSRAQITPVSHGDPSLRDVIVTVEEAQMTTISYGGGLEVDRLLEPDASGVAREQYEFAPRGSFEIGRRNLGGRNRSIDLYTRLSLRPNVDSTNPDDRSAFGFSEYRVVPTYREPLAFHDFGDLTATAAIEQGVRTSFDFARKGFNTELTHRFSKSVRASARYSLDSTRIFNDTATGLDQVEVDRLFPQVRISAFSVAVSRDTRDDLLEPNHGFLLSADDTIAGRAIGSEVGFSKTFLQGFVYHSLGKRDLVFAGGVRLGVATAFPRVVATTDDQGNPTTAIVRQLPASERFFAGGDTTIRGFALDSVGTPATINSQGFPEGGDSDIVLNAELRMPITRSIGAVVFTDGGNVFATTSDLDLGQLRGSVGFGARYKSPIGPIRVDIGFKLDRRVIGGQLEPRYALHFSIGQAF